MKEFVFQLGGRISGKQGLLGLYARIQKNAKFWSELGKLWDDWPFILLQCGAVCMNIFHLQHLIPFLTAAA